MDVRITTRRATVGSGMLRRAEERVRRLERYEPRLQAVSLLFDEDHGRVTVEVRADVPGVPTLVTSSESDSSRASLDSALDKMRRRLRRERSRRVEHQAPPVTAIVQE